MLLSLLIAWHNLGAFEKGSKSKPEIQLAIILFTYCVVWNEKNGIGGEY